MAQFETRKKILFLCTHNSARSQMAEGILNFLGRDRFKAFSAGTEPSRVDPRAIRVIAEIGIDISHHRSKGIEAFADETFDLVVTVCDRANESCPYFAGGKERLHRGFGDPSGMRGNEDERLEAFRRVRDLIRNWIAEEFLQET